MNDHFCIPNDKEVSLVETVSSFFELLCLGYV